MKFVALTRNSIAAQPAFNGGDDARIMLVSVDGETHRKMENYQL